MPLTIVKHPLEFYTERLREKRPFTFSRWGDGEWASALSRRKHHTKNCDGHPFYQQMGQDLRNVLLSRPKYFLGMQPLAAKLYGKAIARWLRQKGLGDLEWHDADVLHKASQKGKLRPFMDAVRDSPLILAGPPHLKKVRSLLRADAFVEVPRRNCYLHKSRIVADIVKARTGMPDNTVVSVSASMPAEIILDDLYHSFGKTTFLIDTGSLWDPLAGVNSRKYHKTLNIPAMKKGGTHA